MRSSSADTSTGPSLPWLAAGLLLAGLGTVLLGPILPSISLRWHLSDQQTGPLFLCKFIGSFIGGISVPRKLRRGILSGTLLSALGFGLFAISPGLVTGSITLFIAGIGLGQIIASTNILAGLRYQHYTGSALSALNLFFSLGAIATGLLVAGLTPHTGLRNLLFYIAAALLLSGLAGRISQRTTVLGAPFMRASAHEWDTSAAQPTPNPLLPTPYSLLPTPYSLLPFLLLLFLYGGLETCLAGWLTTFTLRYSDATLLGGQSATVLLLIALTTGRGLSSIALRYISETTIQRLGLALSFLFTAALAASHHAAWLSLWSILLGLSLAPFFPATFALLMHQRPTPRQAGLVLAVSGLGAAAFPPLMGIISTHANLRLAMTIPMALALALLAVSFFQTPTFLTQKPSGESLS